MGVSTDAVLFYGYCWDDEEELPEEARELWGDDEPVLIGHHGSDGWRVPYVYIKASQLVARRGFPQPVDVIPNPQPEWADQLMIFCQRFGIMPPEGDDQPGFWMASWWG